MIDIHCHILAGLDDGPEFVEQSLAMAELAVREGIGTIVATPHLMGMRPDAEQIRVAVAGLNRQLAERGLALNILPGAEVFASASPVTLKDRTLNGTKYLLIEFPLTHLPANARQIVFNLQLHGFCPIVAHPERIPTVIARPEILAALIDEQCLCQITAGSLTGSFGPQVKRCAEVLLKKGLVSFIATDAHSTGHRRPDLTGGLKVATGLIGREAAERLVRDNPARLIAGEPVVNG